jgi:hypothetical protein
MFKSSIYVLCQQLMNGVLRRNYVSSSTEFCEKYMKILILRLRQYKCHDSGFHFTGIIFASS